MIYDENRNHKAKGGNLGVRQQCDMRGLLEPAGNLPEFGRGHDNHSENQNLARRALPLPGRHCGTGQRCKSVALSGPEAAGLYPQRLKGQRQ